MDFLGILNNALGVALSPTTAAYALAAIGIGVHFGYAGLLNFGQAGFMAVGAYAFGITTLTLGWSFPFAFIAAVVASVAFGFILGIPTLRLRADYLAIVTIAAAEIVRYIVSTTNLASVTGGANGLNSFAGSFQSFNPIPRGTYGFGPWTYRQDQLWVFLWGWGLVIIATVVVWLLMRSPWGRVIKGIREDEDAVRSLGKNVYSYKMQALVLGGVFGSLAGVIFILPRSIQPANFATTLTFFTWTILLLGGAATIFGPIIGSMIFWVLLVLTEGVIGGMVRAGIITFIDTTQAGQIRFILLGLALMALVVFRPQGIFGNKKELSFNV